MEVSDDILMGNRDWDPCYLRLLFEDDFHDVTELWKSNVRDEELVTETVRVEREKYCPITEDISLDDATLCSEVEKIEDEWVIYLLLLLKLR